MKVYIVIPAHNEANNIQKTLASLVCQSKKAIKIVVVDDQSSDGTANIVKVLSEKYHNISIVKTNSSNEHLPGSKVINAFNKGLDSLDDDYDIICKFDADLIFPENYLEKITDHFKADPQVGMAGGFCTVERNGSWEIEKLTSKDHLRGALKAYRKECFLEIGKLKPAMGWDTADELLARYHGWKIKTDDTLLVKHLKTTGGTYNKLAKYKQGEAFYRLRYGLPITLIASAKLSFLKKDASLFQDYIRGYFKAKKEKQPYLVSEDEGRFIRNLRFKKMLSKIF